MNNIKNNLNSIIYKLHFAYKAFIKPKKDWSLPCKCDVMLYDASGQDILIPLFDNHRISIHYTRFERVNVFLLLKSLLDINFWKGKLFQAYTDSFIKHTCPKLIVTFIDTSFEFCTISDRWPTIKTCFVQNGYRCFHWDFFLALSNVPSTKLFVDYMFVFSNSVGDEYKKYIGGKTLPLGSMINNLVPIEQTSSINNDQVISFVSQYFDPNQTIGTDKPVTGRQYMEAEKRIFPVLSAWAQKNNYKLNVLCRNEVAHEEIQFYKQLVPSASLNFLNRISIDTHYKNIDSSRIVVFVDSTLGYESLARGNRTAAFSVRGNLLAVRGRDFGWPSILRSTGPYWTSIDSNSDYLRILDYLHSVSDDDWQTELSKYNKKYLEYNPSNTLFSDYINFVMTN